jgi:phosphatidylglycerol:prolipoprotein diacylglycerol transferase
MHPSLYGLPAWHTLWAAAAVVGTAVNLALLRRRGFPVARSLVALVAVGAIAFLGARIEYRLENGAGFEHLLTSGGVRMPGGLVALAVALPLVLRLLGLPVLRFVDTIVAGIAVSIVVGRLGCFLHGCCFGVPAELPWAVEFPRGSPAYMSHAEHGLVTLERDVSLPVHPLSLYYALDALVIAALLLWRIPRARFAGELTLGFLFLRCWSKTLLESLRGVELGSAPNQSGSVELWLALSATVGLVGAAVHWASGRATAGARADAVSGRTSGAR